MSRKPDRRRHEHPARRAALCSLAVLALILGFFTASTVPAGAMSRGGPRVMTKTSWDRIHLGASMKHVARTHGWTAGSCSGVGAPDFVRVPAKYHVEVAGSSAPGRVGFIEAYGKVTGPHGVKAGLKVSRISGFLRHGTEHHASDGSDGWTYWVIPVKSHYFYVRTGDDGGTPHRIITFGLAASHRIANERGQTEGGCI